MTKRSKTVVFFGSGPVAARSLDLLLEHMAVEAVVTKPRPEHHKGAVPVLELAEKRGIKIFTPTNRRELSELFAAKPVQSTLGIVIDYGIIIAQDVIDYFPLGIINSHFSLLPEWRGADPITFAILSGQKKTGISLMLIDAGMDTGDLLAQTPYDIPSACTTPRLTADLIELSDQSLRMVIPLWVKGEVTPAPQEAMSMAVNPEPSYSRKLTKEDGVVDWSKPAEQLEREVRAFIEWPRSRTKLGEIDVVITSAKVVDEQIESSGKIAIKDKRLIVGCGSESLEVLTLKPAGKKEMTATAFLAGYKQRLET